MHASSFQVLAHLPRNLDRGDDCPETVVGGVTEFQRREFDRGPVNGSQSTLNNVRELRRVFSERSDTVEGGLFGAASAVEIECLLIRRKLCEDCLGSYA